MKEIRFTLHALQRMKERGIRAEDVRRVVQVPDQTETDPLDPSRTRAFGRIPVLDDRMVRVIYSEDEACISVITVMPDRNRGRRAP